MIFAMRRFFSKIDSNRGKFLALFWSARGGAPLCGFTGKVVRRMNP